VLAETRLLPHPAARRDSAEESRVELAATRPGGLSGVVRSANLAQDFGLTQDLGIESGGHAEEVPHRGLPIEPGEDRSGLDAPALGELTEPGLEVVITRPVDLKAIAGG
jgi:hypothetical protein